MYDETLIPHIPERGSNRPFAATIKNTPAEDGDDVFVTVPGIDDEQTDWGPCRYSPRGDSLPSTGDDALVIFDDESNLWIIGWWPYG